MRYVKVKLVFILMLCVVFVFVLTGCSDGGGSTSGGSRGSTTDFLVPEASGEITYSFGDISIDASNTSDGYIMVNYTGSAAKIKIQNGRGALRI